MTSLPTPKDLAKPGPAATSVDAQKRRVLEAALQIFEPEHPSRFRVQDVVNAAGMSTKTFYEVFGSRDAVILELADELCSKLIAELEFVIEDTKDPVTRIKRGLAIVVRAVSSTPLFVRGLGDEAEAGLEVQINRFLDAAIDIVDRAAQDAYKNGLISHRPVPLESELLISGAARVVVRAMRSGDSLEELELGLWRIFVRHFAD